jgi:hypothetical protein
VPGHFRASSHERDWKKRSVAMASIASKKSKRNIDTAEKKTIDDPKNGIKIHVRRFHK